MLTARVIRVPLPVICLASGKLSEFNELAGNNP